MTLDELSGAMQEARDGGDEFHLDPTDDGGALVVRGDGTVVAVVRPGHGVTAAEFDAAMTALDATFDRDEWGHGGPPSVRT